MRCGTAVSLIVQTGQSDPIHSPEACASTVLSRTIPVVRPKSRPSSGAPDAGSAGWAQFGSGLFRHAFAQSLQFLGASGFWLRFFEAEKKAESRLSITSMAQGLEGRYTGEH